MRNLLLYFRSLFQGVFSLAVFLAAFYVSVVFFLLSVLEEIWSGKENPSRVARMEMFVEKIQKYAGDERPQQRKHLQVDESVS
ncbi:hypothetical protein RCC89_08215 [Cytophagaceae bacterium ABcell3]|nr:hypothetical protein RCC89_08215 [Cytophagaceae bacterium ABcell3]